MAHDRDHDHPPPAPLSGRAPVPLSSRSKPDSKRQEHPSVVPREPVDPKPHPSRT